jgi:hypothetical protein
MTSEPVVTDAYLEHLTTDDLSLLLAGESERPQDSRADMHRVAAGFRSRPARLDELLGSQRVFDMVFSETSRSEPLLSASPFLVFAVCVQRAASELGSVSYVEEWLGPGRRAPVFDVAQLREFMSIPRRRLFLAELLASYTHVSSGSVVFFTRRGLRRQRFSELDPVRLAGLLEVVSEGERPGILRRLGDLALFLTGVFPDHVARKGFGPIEEGRLLRSGTVARTDAPARPSSLPFGAQTGAVGLLDQLGRRWYRAAFDLLPRPVPENVAVLEEMSERFDQARRILGLITEKFLFAHRDRWFGLSQ